MKCFKNNKYIFSINEYNALQKITNINKMDCWFMIKRSRDGKTDYIYDLEEHKRLSLTTALNYIYEGLFWEDLLLLDIEEQKALEKLFERFL